jgi:hypothetical protein
MSSSYSASKMSTWPAERMVVTGSAQAAVAKASETAMLRRARERAEQATAVIVVVLMNEGMFDGSSRRGLDEQEYMQLVVMCNIFASKE